MTSRSPSVSIVIVNHNSGPLLSRCLQALTPQQNGRDILIIDNASTDGSARQVFQTFPGIRIVPLRYNVGFSRAVNVASDLVDSEVMVLLNPDTVPYPDFLDEIVAPLAADRNLGAVSGTLVFDSNPQIIASAGISVHRNGVAIDDRLGERLQVEAAPQPVFGASGGAAAYRLRAFHEAGRFPDSFFMYLEDVDLAWRLRMRGWEAVWSPKAVVRHAYSAAAGEGSPFKQRLLARNRIWTLVRSLPAEFWKRDRAHILAFDAAAVAFGAVQRNRATVLGRAEAWLTIPPRLCERRAIQSCRAVDLDTLDAWLRPPISPGDLLRLRRLTARFTSTDHGERPGSSSGVS